MQSDEKSFSRDVVLDSYNIAYGDEDSIRDPKNKRRIFWDLLYEDFKSE